MEELDNFVENLLNKGWSFNAKKNFNKFLSSITDNNDLTSECKEIYKILNDIVLGKTRNQFEKVLAKGSIYYRARIIEVKDYENTDVGIGIKDTGELSGYNEDNSREPIIGISGNGRNNIAGVSYLYIATDPETACMEVKSQFGDLISLAMFELCKDIHIIDFSSDINFAHSDTVKYNMSIGQFFTLLMSQYCIPLENPNAYRATQIISDYLRKTGIDGVAYKSFFVPGGVNYTLFHSHPSIIKFIGSKILIHKQANHSFWDFNERRAIFSNDKENMEYNQNKADQYLSDINFKSLSKQ